MSNSTTENAAEELDLTDIFSLFKRWAYSVLALFFKALDFIKKYWWILLILIATGVLLGIFSESPATYKSTVIVKTNFDSQPYVYNAIKQLEKKISDRDGTFIKNNKLAYKDNAIITATITPIIDVVSLLEGISASDSRSLGSVLKELTVEDDEELFASERFYSNFQYHKLEIGLLGTDAKMIQHLVDYVNSQPSLIPIKEGYIKNQEDRIASNEKTLSQVNIMIDRYGDNLDVVSKNAKNLSYYNNENNINLNGVLELKNKLVLETEELKNQQITSTDALVVLSDAEVVKDVGFTDKKEIYYPILFLSIFFLLAAVRFTYLTFRQKLVEGNYLD